MRATSALPPVRIRRDPPDLLGCVPGRPSLVLATGGRSRSPTIDGLGRLIRWGGDAGTAGGGPVVRVPPCSLSRRQGTAADGAAARVPEDDDPHLPSIGVLGGDLSAARPACSANWASCACSEVAGILRDRHRGRLPSSSAG
jgi:hypothetical protein